MAHASEKDKDYLEIEQDLRKRFRKNLWCRFTRAIREYDLVQEGDRIAVCISGGKDSMLMAKLFQELKRHNKFDFEVKFLVMDPGYRTENRQLIESNARRLNVPLTIFSSDIFESVFHIENSPCYLCARMRRGHLYSRARAKQALQQIAVQKNSSRIQINCVLSVHRTKLPKLGHSLLVKKFSHISLRIA